jgi:hypothetical protein
MALVIDDLVSGIEKSHQFFLKHLDGLREDQWDWKPYTECRSIRETIVHLIEDYRAMIYLLDKGKFPDFAEIREKERDLPRLLATFDETEKQLSSFIKTKFAKVSLDTEIDHFFGKKKLGLAICEISQEIAYHIGQVAFIRMATDPSWDYYASVYTAE